MLDDLGHAVGEMFDAIGEATRLNDGGNRIEFFCVPSIVPNDVLGYLEKFGVYARPASGTKETEEGRELKIYVRPGQYWYAAGLIQGYAPGGVHVIDPHQVRPIKPSRSWGRPVKTKGTLATVLRFFR